MLELQTDATPPSQGFDFYTVTESTEQGNDVFG